MLTMGRRRWLDPPPGSVPVLVLAEGPDRADGEGWREKLQWRNAMAGDGLSESKAMEQ